MIEGAVTELKRLVSEHDGSNAAGRGFCRRVDELIDAFYDDIGEVTRVPTRTLFDLFVIKVLYVERRGTDAGVVDYLGWLLERFLYTEELFPVGRSGRPSLYYLSDLLAETKQMSNVQNLFEAYRKYGENSLFVTGVFPRALRRKRARRSAFVDQSY